MAIKRLKEHAEIQQHLLLMLFNDAINHPHDGKWRNYEREFFHEAAAYVLKCQFQYDGIHLTYRNFKIEHAIKEIYIGEH